MADDPLDPQARTITFLSGGDAFGTPVEQVETHTAIVFLAAGRAYKLKKNVKYSYLDYSTVELRRASCEAELAINRRFAPFLYLGVEPITTTDDGRLSVGGSGPVVDWVVVMRRFDQKCNSTAWRFAINCRWS